MTDDALKYKIVGSKNYSFNSSICLAAVHAGAIKGETGGIFKFMV